MILTERLILRSWKEEDRQEFIGLAEDPEVSCWTGRTVSSEEIFSYYLSLDTSYAVVLEGRVIGNVSFFRNSTTSSAERMNVYEASFYFLPEFQGKGYATEAFRAACDHVFSSLHADAVLVGILEGNSRAVSFIQKNGGRYCFTRKTASGEDEMFYVLV